MALLAKLDKKGWYYYYEGKSKHIKKEEVDIETFSLLYLRPMNISIVSFANS